MAEETTVTDGKTVVKDNVAPGGAGKSSTEFWVTIVATGIVALGAVFGKAIPEEQVVEFLQNAMITYISGRSLVKAAGVFKK